MLEACVAGTQLHVCILVCARKNTHHDVDETHPRTNPPACFAPAARSFISCSRYLQPGDTPRDRVLATASVSTVYARQCSKVGGYKKCAGQPSAGSLAHQQARTCFSAVAEVMRPGTFDTTSSSSSCERHSNTAMSFSKSIIQSSCWNWMSCTRACVAGGLIHVGFPRHARFQHTTCRRGLWR